LKKTYRLQKILKKVSLLLSFKKTGGAKADKLITAYQVRSRRYGRIKANNTITLVSVRWSACSVTASGGGAESCPTVLAVVPL